MLQVAVIANHQNGRDTHVRQVPPTPPLTVLLSRHAFIPACIASIAVAALVGGSSCGASISASGVTGALPSGWCIFPVSRRPASHLLAVLLRRRTPHLGARGCTLPAGTSIGHGLPCVARPSPPAGARVWPPCRAHQDAGPRGQPHQPPASSLLLCAMTELRAMQHAARCVLAKRHPGMQSVQRAAHSSSNPAVTTGPPGTACRNFLCSNPPAHFTLLTPVSRLPLPTSTQSMYCSLGDK